MLWHQLRSPLLGLLLAAAVASYFVGERSDAVIIGVIVALSVGLGLVNEYRAEKAAEALHSQIHHQALVVRDGHPVGVDVTALVPGDIVDLRLGDIVPADIRLLQTSGLECDESVLTGESLPVEKSRRAGAGGYAAGGACRLRADGHRGARRQRPGGGHRDRGAYPVRAVSRRGWAPTRPRPSSRSGCAGSRCCWSTSPRRSPSSIFVINVVLHRPILDALLFSLAIAVGITPQLLPAVVSMSLAAGSRQMARRKVLVKRLVCIEDLGDIDTLFTDKTGTLTQGRISFMRAVSADGTAARARRCGGA